MIISLVAVLVLLFLSAFFSGSETALTGASQAYMIDQEKNCNNSKAKTVNRLFRHRDNLIITTLLGSNLSNTLATSLSTSVLIGMFGNEGVAYATVIMTLLVLIYTDMLPKSYSVQNANKVALLVAPFIKIFVFLFHPVVWVLQKIVSVTFRIFKLDRENCDNGNCGLSEVRGAIHMYEGKDAAQEKAMLKSILDLTDIEVYDVMNHRKNLFSLDVDLPVKEIIKKVENCPFSRIPLYKDKPENIVGVIRVKTLLKEAVAKKGNLQDIKITEIMNKPWFIPDNTTLMRQLQLFRARREHFAIVVDEYGGTAGMISMEDILEELVGDILDEHDDISDEPIKKIDDTSCEFDGLYLVEDAFDCMGLPEFETEESTIGGYVFGLIGREPKIGDQAEDDYCRYEVMAVDNMRITRVKIHIKEKNQAED